MKYECKHAYRRENMPYILCSKEKTPLNKADIYHSLCPHQRFCAEKNCAILTETWAGCKKHSTQAPQEKPGATSKKTRKKAE